MINLPAISNISTLTVVDAEDVSVILRVLDTGFGAMLIELSGIESVLMPVLLTLTCTVSETVLDVQPPLSSERVMTLVPVVVQLTV